MVLLKGLLHSLFQNGLYQCRQIAFFTRHRKLLSNLRFAFAQTHAHYDLIALYAVKSFKRIGIVTIQQD